MKKIIIIILVTLIITLIYSVDVFADDNFPVLDGGVTKIVPSFTGVEVWMSASTTKAVITGGVSLAMLVLGPLPKMSKEMAAIISTTLGGFISSKIGDGKFPACIVRCNFFRHNQFALQTSDGQAFGWMDFQ